MNDLEIKDNEIKRLTNELANCQDLLWRRSNSHTNGQPQEEKETIKDDRDYAIRKGKILERFTEEFHARHRHDALYVSVYEALIRDADPYEIIEKLIAVNDAQFKHIQLIIRYVSADYYLEKKQE
jgi:hypothetical protein